MKRRMKYLTPTWPKHPLAREIALAVVIKLLVIVALYYAFFAGAPRLDADAVADRLIQPQVHTSN